MKLRVLLIIILCLSCLGCQQNNCVIEPTICYSPPSHLIDRLPTPFKKLTAEEASQDWGKELNLGKAFAHEMDLYRALTCFKRARFLIPREEEQRLMEIEYEIFLAYFLGNKYQEAVETFENSQLIRVPEDFPALHDLLITLYEAYIQVDQPERACRILGLISLTDTETAINLDLGTKIVTYDIPEIIQASERYSNKDSIDIFLTTYQIEAKSLSKARALNAVLPGAGYLYVGQKKAALTSLVINTLFIAAAYQLFERGYVPAGLIITSLEMGWYFGGINGAGLAAKEYNERLYENLGKQLLIQDRLFPILMIQKGF